MNNNPETDLDLDKLFLPAWAQEPATGNRYAKFQGEPEGDRRERRGDRFGPGRPRDERRDRPPRREGGPPAGQDRGRPPRSDDRGPRRPQWADRDEGRDRPPAPPQPFQEITLTLRPEEKGVDSLARQIRMTGRAYPLFQIAQLILEKPERHMVAFDVKKNAEGQPLQPLFLCALDDTLWLSEQEAVTYVLDRHFGTFYQAERTATEPPKGKYTFVAQCGLSGAILGPPNHHEYQNQVRKLHAERFSRMPFEVFKSRIRIVREEAVVKKWIDDQSWKTEFVCLNVPEPLRVATREALEKHFREVHLANIIKPVDSYTLNGKAARSLRSPGLVRLVREAVDQQRRFPLQISTTLSQQFASRGLQFFKVNRFVTHVSVARPHFLDLETTPVSEGVRGIVRFIEAHPKCSRRQLVESLAPTPVAAPIPAPAEAIPVAPLAEGEPGGVPTVPPVGETPAPQAAAAPTAPAVEPAGPTPEQNAVIGDLHWLIHQGHVIEFANGTLETAKKPVLRPPKPQAKPADAKSAAGARTSAEEPKPESEAVVTAEEAAMSGQQQEAAAGTPTEAESEPEPATPAPAEPAAAVPAPEPEIPPAPVAMSADSPAVSTLPQP
jgi:hypothetical protein